ncbi:MAG: AzlD domain-containing protein [Erysipelotrichaceae bacterium]|nr:AzlD domain-containing protein [Erysipelotrichaceae bacterium]
MTQAIMSIVVMAVVTYLVRMLPLVLFTKKIENQTVKSFLAYVPCVVLATMTFPAIFSCTSHWLSGVIGAIVAIFFGYQKRSLVEVAIIAVVTVFIVERFI